MATREDKIANLKADIKERQRVYDYICSSYSEAKIKILTFVGGDLALLTFLYSSGSTFIPPQTYGKIFYYIGIGLTIYGLGLLFKALRPRYWEFPIEDKDIDKIDSLPELEYLRYIQNRYKYSYDIDLPVYEEKQTMLNNSFVALVIGGIILVVIKLFVGAAK